MRRYEYIRLAIELLMLGIALVFLTLNMFEVQTIWMFVGLVYLAFFIPLMFLLLSRIFWRSFLEEKQNSQKSQGSL